ncbi:MAG: hypothetical protein WC683_04865 [bacterium]
MAKIALEAPMFKKMVAALKDTIGEGRLHYEDNRLWLRSVDASNSAMIAVTCEKEAFLSADGKPATWCMNLKQLHEALSKCSIAENDDAVIEVTKARTQITIGQVEMTFANLDEKTVRQDPNEPRADLATKALIGAAALQESLKVAQAFNDKVKVMIHGDVVCFESGDEDIGTRVFVKLTADGVQGDAFGLYSLEYLKAIIKHLDGEVGIAMADKQPILLTWSIGGGIGFTYLLAPRIEQE